MKQTYFDKNYPGPRGPHLNCRTHYTITNEQAKMENQISIHPSKTMSGNTVRRSGDN